VRRGDVVIVEWLDAASGEVNWVEIDKVCPKVARSWSVGIVAKWAKHVILALSASELALVSEAVVIPRHLIVRTTRIGRIEGLDGKGKAKLVLMRKRKRK
jgi:hypothetical protein